MKKTNPLATWSLITSFFIPILGIIFGFMALRSISKDKSAGRGLALSGIIISIIILTFQVIVVLGLVYTEASCLQAERAIESKLNLDSKTKQLVDRKEIKNSSCLGNFYGKSRSVTYYTNQPEQLASVIKKELVGYGFKIINQTRFFTKSSDGKFFIVEIINTHNDEGSGYVNLVIKEISPSDFNYYDITE